MLHVHPKMSAEILQQKTKIKRCQVLGPVSQKILSPLVILSMEKTMVTMVISET